MADGGEYCDLAIPISRNPWPYLIRFYAIDNMFIFGAVLSLQLDASIPPLVGARCSLIALAALLLMTGLRQRGEQLSLGSIEYLMLIDVQTL